MDYEKNRIITQEELNKMGEELSNYAESLINRQFKKISNDMNYEQKYNKALERARKLKENPQGVFYEYSPDERDTICDYIFPELKESEDEKTKRILYSISSKISFHLHDIFTEGEFQCFDAWSNVWLEKQGGQNDSDVKDYNSIDPHFGKSIDKVEPKFKVGDWVVFNNKHQSIYQVEKIEDGYYILRHTHGGTFRVCVLHDESLRLWTIKDARDGDVLAEDPWSDYPSPFVAIYKKQNKEDFDSYCFIGFNGKFYEGEMGHSTEYIHPATKEQCDILFKEMKEAGYEWDVEKKELKKIEQKPAWSVEVQEEQVSEEFINALGTMLNDGLPDRYLVSEERIKKSAELLFSIARKQLKNEMQEWSEEDEKMCQETIDWFEKKCFPYALGNDNPARESIKWLKSLKQRIGG